MTRRSTFVSWTWRILVCTLVLVLAQMLGVPLTLALGLELPRAPGAVDPAVQAVLLVPAAAVMALAMAWIAVGLAGSWRRRWLILGAFFYVVHAVGNAMETSIFTTLGGDLGAAVMALPAMLLGSLVVVRLFPGPPEERGLAALAGERFEGWSAGRLAGRLLLGWIAFPFFYFLFGALIAPIVVPHYERLEFLVIPPMPTMLAVLFTRSALFLVVSLLVIVAWRASRGGLLLGLGFGHFAAVGLVGLIQAPFMPAVLRWTHGVEILADSFAYAAVLVWLFFARREGAAEGQPSLRERAA